MFTSRSHFVKTRSLRVEVRSQFLYKITDKVLKHNIPGELIINVDQKPSKFVDTDNVTIAAKGEKHISRAGATDKRTIIVTLSEFLDGHILPFQLILRKRKDLYQTSLFLMDSA